MATDGRRSLGPQLIATTALLALGLVFEAVPAGEGAVPSLGAALRNDGLNRIDVEHMERGYYEALLDVGQRLDAPAVGTASATSATPSRSREAGQGDPELRAGGLAVAVDDVREHVLRPNLAIMHRGGRWTTSSAGLRDREYAAEKPPGTVRIALIGDSIGAGWGVDDAETFEALLEQEFDARSRAANGPAIEILNYAVPGLAPGQRWETFQRAGGWERGIDVVLYEATPADLGWDERRLRALLPRGLGVDAGVYRETLARLNIPTGRSPDVYRRLLRSHRQEILGGVYRRIAADCAARGVPCLWVLIPRVGKAADSAERADLIRLAHAAGFTATIDLSDTFAGADPAALAVAPDDYHPNADGHARIARRLDAALRDRPELVRLAPGLAGAPTPGGHPHKGDGMEAVSANVPRQEAQPR